MSNFIEIKLRDVCQKLTEQSDVAVLGALCEYLGVRSLDLDALAGRIVIEHFRGTEIYRVDNIPVVRRDNIGVEYTDAGPVVATRKVYRLWAPTAATEETSDSPRPLLHPKTP